MTVLVKPKKAKLAILNKDAQPERIFNALKENLEGTDLSPFVFVRIPAGGNLHWSVPTLDDPEGEPKKEIIGVPLARNKSRSYWARSIDEGGGGRPDCFSRDGFTGEGMYGVGSDMAEAMGHGGKCMGCPMAQWERDEASGRMVKPDCNEFTNLYLLEEDGDVFPLAFQLTGPSGAAWDKFARSLAFKGYTLNSSVVKLTLEKAKSQDGIVYSLLKPEFVQPIPDEQTQSVKGVRAALENDLLNKNLIYADAYGALPDGGTQEALPGVSEI